ncbi:LOW QUALITY PROTEIN: polyadenylate-binding protein-interacting protein 7 [Andrographis paniculata]|uniref:LOW QUALITY PROTEIN: polyadenylate-binding protein-interacting protein 7 n=1 Tax=Andrographis paniculata TaxID=175694 RepID=UPI0021E74409|nr:LOW QUALITY PROTEIN: polyadenylate-binding protein-interacting protein 7 [Andrographis paniculata]
MSNEQFLLDSADINPIEFFASQSPGFAAESLAEVYFANGSELNLTIEMLTQLELQVDGGLNETLYSKTLSTPKLSTLDFPALSLTEGQTGMSAADLHQNSTPYQSRGKESTLSYRSSSSIPSGGATDFASAVRKMASQDSSVWEYDRSGSSDANIGSTRGSKVVSIPYSSGGHERGIYGDRLQSWGSAQDVPSVWLETGEAVGNMCSEMREEARRDHARIRNAYFEQARQAHLIGNKALAKELSTSTKGQLHNMRMKAAHGKAQESIFGQRNQDMAVHGRGERMIDLHGLHVSEAIHMLKPELGVLRSAARWAEQRMPAYIFVGTGHHTRGSSTPARLPTAIQRYLLEEEECPQAGLASLGL